MIFFKLEKNDILKGHIWITIKTYIRTYDLGVQLSCSESTRMCMHMCALTQTHSNFFRDTGKIKWASVTRTSEIDKPLGVILQQWSVIICCAVAALVGSYMITP